MLVLSRKINESLFIGGEIKITVVDVRGDKARIGIDAPSAVPVHRQEVFDAIDREHRIDRSVCPCCGHKRQEGVSDEV